MVCDNHHPLSRVEYPTSKGISVYRIAEKIGEYNSNDLNISADKLLREYKTQDSVEKKFQQLKSPQFVNSLYLESTKRVEAMAYLMIIAVMTLSVAEYVVRRGLKEDNDFIIRPGKVKMTRPTLMAIY